VRSVITIFLLTVLLSSVDFRPTLQPASGEASNGGHGLSRVIRSAPLYAQPADDPWGFDEDDSETWQEILRPQAADVALTTAFLAFAMVSFFRKSVPLKYVTFVLAVGYMGFYKSNLISVVNIFGVIDQNLPIAKHNVMWYIFAVFTVVSTVLWGRVYCGRICAFGALTQLMDATLPKKLRVEPPAWLEQRAAWIKYGLLASVILYYLATRNLMVYRYVEPFWMFGLSESWGLWIGLAVLLIATVFVRNLYCRFLCPVGAMLGIISNLTVFKIKRWSECKTCKLCEKTCEWGAIQGPKIVKSECVRCDDCERLYMDQKKCPHWIIILRKADKVAASAPVRSI
jgi:NosR/NirI family transcriptional regulator, nitrous oxide reductase regulator